MNPYHLKKSVTVRDHLLSILLRFSKLRAVNSAFKKTYLIIIRLVSLKLKTISGVEFIYLRRGVAKDEFMPLLSDIDITVITRDVASREKANKILKKISKIMPVIEPLSNAMTLDEFNSIFKKDFSRNKSFLYRFFEGKNTWKTLHANQPSDPLKNIEMPDEDHIRALVMSEIFYWHGIVISEYTAYHMRRDHKLNYFRSKRLCWVFMKATTELTNFVGCFSNIENLKFFRAQILRTAYNELKVAGWDSLSNKNMMILANRFDPKEAEEYLKQAFEYLSLLYEHLFRLLASAIEHDWKTVEWYRSNCLFNCTDQIPAPHAVELNKISLGETYEVDNLSSVYLTPLPCNNSNAKVLIVFVIDALNSVNRKDMLQLLHSLQEQFKFQNILPSEISLDMVDRFGFLSFSTPHQFGLQSTCIFKKNLDCRPSLYEMISDRSLSRRGCMENVRGFNTRIT